MNTSLPGLITDPKTAPGGIATAGQTETAAPAQGDNSGKISVFQSVISKLFAGKNPSATDSLQTIDTMAQPAPNGLSVPGESTPTLETPLNTASASRAEASPKTSVPKSAKPDSPQQDSVNALTGAMMLMLSAVLPQPEPQPSATPPAQPQTPVGTSSDALTVSADARKESQNPLATLPGVPDAKTSGSTVPTATIPSASNVNSNSQEKAPQLKVEQGKSDQNTPNDSNKSKAITKLVTGGMTPFTGTIPEIKAADSQNSPPSDQSSSLPQTFKTVPTQPQIQPEMRNETPPPAQVDPVANQAIIADMQPSTTTPLTPDSQKTNTSQNNPHQQVTTHSKSLANPSADTGTGIALSKERMNNSEEKNKSAGNTGQKLPSNSGNGDTTANGRSSTSATSGKVVRNAGSSPTNNSVVNTATFDSNTQPQVSSANITSIVAENRASVNVERISRMVTEEVVAIHRTGASELAVSLKVDSKTELFLKVSTTSTGELQATLHCEKGSVEALNRHWPELQASLARQNIELLPSSNSQPISSTQSNSGQTTGDHNQSGNQRDQNASAGNHQNSPEGRHTPTVAEIFADKPVTKQKQSSRKNSTAQGWESWA